MTETVTSQDDDTPDWREFLTDRPPGTRARVDRAAYPEMNGSTVAISLPEIQLFCDGKCQCISYCRGNTRANGKLFGGLDPGDALPNTANRQASGNLPLDAVISYTCEKCGRVAKSYSVRFTCLASSAQETALADVQKIAEWPPFSPRTPPKLIRLIEPDRDLFLKGRRAEIEGLGIGAFSYYRRMIERQKNRLLDEIIKVARTLNIPVEIIARLENAKLEIQFSKAVESVKDAIPTILFIKGHNPFTLLHTALSRGLHEASDEECLAAANDIRVVLIAFAERLTEVTREQRELDAALSRLMNPASLLP